MSLLYLIIGLALILIGAQYLVEGSTVVAKRYNMSEFLIGLTIVGIGTSMPEMVVSMIGSINGSGTVAIGNVVGSNAANTLLILGLTAVVRPIPMERNTIRFDIPYCIMVSVLLMVLAFGFTFWQNSPGVVMRWEGALLLALFALFMVRSFRDSRKTAALEVELNKEYGTGGAKPKKKIKLWLAAVMIAGGLCGLIFGGDLFVLGAVQIASALGVSESVISITVLALGTSMPELATSVVAALKGQTQLALGNILGSNIANITLILGMCAVVNPLGTGEIQITDMYVMILSALLLALSTFTFRKKVLDRPEGIVLLLVYFAYVYMLSAEQGAVF